MPLFTETVSTLHPALSSSAVPVRLDRHTLEKRRWRMTADDGTDIAAALSAPASHGQFLFSDDGRAFVIQQVAEPVLRVRLPDDPLAAARIGWIIGNQHLQAAFVKGALLVAHEPHTEQLLQRLGFNPSVENCLFRPDPHSAAHQHHH